MSAGTFAAACVMVAVLLIAAWVPHIGGREIGPPHDRAPGGAFVAGRQRRHRSVPLYAAAVVAACLALVMVGPVLTGVIACLALARRWSSGRRQRRRSRRMVEVALPDALDLFVVSLGAGLRPAECFELLAPLVGPPLRPAWGRVVDRIGRGERFADAVVHLGDELGPDALAFATTLAVTDASGLALTPAIDRLADDARQQRRRSAEAAARELPVRLAFPLVLCTLPAFALVAIVPLLLGALSSLRAT